MENPALAEAVCEAAEAEAAVAEAAAVEAIVAEYREGKRMRRRTELFYTLDEFHNALEIRQTHVAEIERRHQQWIKEDERQLRQLQEKHQLEELQRERCLTPARSIQIVKYRQDEVERARQKERVLEEQIESRKRVLSQQARRVISPHGGLPVSPYRNYSPTSSPLRPHLRMAPAGFKNEHLVIIVPGSTFTLAQLGLPESLAPAAVRQPSRVFPTKDGKYEPSLVRERKKPANGDLSAQVDGLTVEQAELEYEEDVDSDEGAVYPIQQGRIANMPAFLALLHHFHSVLAPPLHSPIMLISDPSWTAKQLEEVTNFVFEKLKPPAFCIVDSGYAACYAMGLDTATVIDVGYEKVSITAVHQFEFAARETVPDCGGEAMTRRLHELLKPKGFTKDMAEQLKRNAICEILPPGTPLPGADSPDEPVSNPAAAASTGAISSGPGVKVSDAPRGPGENTEVGEDGDVDNIVDEEGVLDVATIVTSGKTQEFIAKAEKAKSRKQAKEAKEAAEAAAKPVKLPNSKRKTATFWYEEKRVVKPEGEEANKEKTPEPASATGESAPALTGEAAAEQAKAARREERRKEKENQGNPNMVRREIEVGIERFQAADDLMLTLADAVDRVISSVEISKRGSLWDHLVIVGNGSLVRGFKESLLATLNSTKLVTPSTASIFLSELPSNTTTPVASGVNTPDRSLAHGLPALPALGSGVNPLLLAATTAANPALHPNVSSAALGTPPPGATSSQGQPYPYVSHTQQPQSIKIVDNPSYFPEYKNNFQEAGFLGACIAASNFFVQEYVGGAFMTRSQYNESGPADIHQLGWTG